MHGGSQNLFLCGAVRRRIQKNASFHTFYRTTFYRHQTLALPSREHPLKPAYLCSLAFGVMTRRIAKWTQWPVAVASPFKFQNSTLISYARNVTRVRNFSFVGSNFFFLKQHWIQMRKPHYHHSTHSWTSPCFRSSQVPTPHTNTK